MERKNLEQTIIVISKDKVITREKLFEDKENFHKEQAHLPFEEKIKILVKLQEITSKVKVKGRDKIIWKISRTPDTV